MDPKAAALAAKRLRSDDAVGSDSGDDSSSGSSSSGSSSDSDHRACIHTSAHTLQLANAPPSSCVRWLDHAAGHKRHKKDKKKTHKKKDKKHKKDKKKHHKHGKHDKSEAHESGAALARAPTPSVGPRNVQDETMRNEEPLNEVPELKITEDDYFSRNSEFRLWLLEDRHVYFDDLKADEARRMFDKFVDKWNAGKLKSAGGHETRGESLRST